MDRIRIVGGQRLQGTIAISGAKNAALPLMIASLLTRETLTLHSMPRLADVTLLGRILGNHGVDITIAGKKAGQSTSDGQTFRLTSGDIVDTTAPYEMVARMRASFWVLAPILARCGEAKVSLPGGCAIGTRPVDLHLSALEALGAEIELEGGYVIAKAPKGLVGGRIHLGKVSVGATHNALMAAVLARGDSVIENAAREPEVADLANCLVKMGAKIEGIGTDTMHIEGVTSLHEAEHTVLPDRIETGTYAMAAAITGGEVFLEGARPDLLREALQLLQGSGVEVEETATGIRVARNGSGLEAVSVETQPFPGFPTDLQAQLMALMCTARGVSEVRETIFENRFMHVQELARLGANIDLNGDTALVTGVEGLTGAQVMATDLRASVSLIIAGLAAQGETLIGRVYHLDRGFDRIEEKLRQCGAQIDRLSG
ncbi:MAG: UDP-N-acetylglucosamine 1-carboxyvinyltransferase [Hyphomicrobiaceae bacterium]|jgi:UDP-N-acetylglucosamine 1-carboxyvinyltransferase|nr:UDP-N-acetylglucosamine 1-carboxyvinyltransferase [Methyloceanibacter sp.]MDX2317886.1 UDP-N-acetylglucosamine 1-carboxyvinyltransferase [Hyphomicrobiaceae bacterium]MDX2449913.1 UDP-N-acetylglucosamine 1-carboxyvinyltransferase [Hyphomicrobiaceae bacterium]